MFSEMMDTLIESLDESPDMGIIIESPKTAYLEYKNDGGTFTTEHKQHALAPKYPLR